MGWGPVVVQSLASLAVMVAIGLAVIGQVRWRATKEWESLAEARHGRISELEGELKKHREESAREVEFLKAAMHALEGQIADLQRFNLELQRKLAARPRRAAPEEGVS